jgi:hypothetical protein
MHFLEYVKWLEKEDASETGFSDFGWISISELEAYDPDNTLLDNYTVMLEYVSPLGSIYWFLLKKSCQSEIQTMQQKMHQE